MALLQSTQAKNRYPVPTADTATDLVPIFASFVIPTGMALNDVIEMGPLPAGYVPSDLLVGFDDADSNGTPTIKFDAGLLSGNWLDPNGAGRTCGSEFFAADTTAQAGGVQRLNKAAGTQIAPTTNVRSWGLKVNTAAATLTVGAKINATLYVRPAIEGQ